MPETISANTLFHLTDEIEKIRSILKNGFYPSFCKEPHIGLMVPMVSFCDIPVSKLKNHISRYGSYGIGLRKNFAFEHGVSPILYTLKGCSTYDFIEKGVERAAITLSKFMDLETRQVRDINPSKEELLDALELIKGATDIAQFSKPYRDATTVYYNEREWRYVPKIEILDGHTFLLSLKDIKPEQIQNANNEVKEHYTLKFNIEDINYIIVKNFEDVESVLETIDEIYPDADLKQKRLLQTRIMTINQIEEDF